MRNNEKLNVEPQQLEQFSYAEIEVLKMYVHHYQATLDLLLPHIGTGGRAAIPYEAVKRFVERQESNPGHYTFKQWQQTRTSLKSLHQALQKEREQFDVQELVEDGQTASRPIPQRKPKNNVNVPQ